MAIILIIAYKFLKIIEIIHNVKYFSTLFYKYESYTNYAHFLTYII
jgi:hypothetical protein